MRKRIIALLLALILTVGLLPTVALAADEVTATKMEPVIVEDSGDNTTFRKTISENDDGSYKVTLEAWATGKTIVEETKIPLDIVLVLDKSGSMKETFSTKSETIYRKIERSDFRYNEYYWNWSADNIGLWYKVGENYYKVNVDRSYDAWKVHFVYTYTYQDSNGQMQTIGTSTRRYRDPGYDFYRKEVVDSTTTKMNALKEAATSFATTVQKKAAEDKLEHRIAVVSYSTDAYIETGSNVKSALVEVNKDTGLETVKNAINKLEADGGTQIDLGIKKANEIFEANKIEEGKRARVVIAFTDGTPGLYGYWAADGWYGSNNFNTHETANAAIQAAHSSINTHKASVYTIGIFDGADNATLPNYTKDAEVEWDYNRGKWEYVNKNVAAQAVANSNRFMHLVSSNYPTAKGMEDPGKINSELGENSFYLAASSAGELSEVFDAIGNTISTVTTTLNDKATIVDEVPSNFTISANAKNISLKVANCIGENNGALTFGEPEAAPEAVKAERRDKTVRVNGFNFSDKWCGKENDVYRGQKLIVSFDITHNNYGGTQPTNDGACIKDASGESFIDVDNPAIPVKITKPSITGVTRSKVYDGTGFDVLSTIAKDINALADGKKNAYVDIVVTVTSGSNTYTYTIKKGDKSGSWDKTGLTTDKDVKIENGTVSNYTYDLSITFKDATANGAADAIEKTTATYTITKRPVTLTSETASKPYDGTPLTKPEVTVTDYNDGKNIFKNEVTDIKANGSVIDPGPAVTNAITYTPGANFKATNYNISKSEGKLSINDIAGPTNLPKVTVHCTNTEVVHADSDENALTNGSYMSIVSKNATSNSYICTVTLTDKSDYINAYNTSTGATHVSDTSKNDTTEIVLTYDVTNKTWNAPTESFFLNVKCDTPTVTVTYEWTGLEGVVFDDDQHKAPTLPKGETVTKGSPHTVDFMYLNGSTVTDVHGNVYKFSGWDKSDTFTVQKNTTIRGTWTKSTGTFELDGKIFKSFTAPDDVQKDFYVTVTPQQGATTDIRTGMLSLTGSTTTDVQFNFYNRSRITFTEPNTYTYLVEETFDRGAHPDGIVDKIHFDTKQYQLTIVVDNNLNVTQSYFTALPQTDGAEHMPTITFENEYDEDPDADIVTLDLSKYVTKTFESRHGKSATETFEAKVQIWLDNVPIITNAAAEKDSIAIYAAENGEKVYDKTGTVTLSTGETKSFSFSENPVLTKGNKYKVVITEIKGSNPDVEYDTTEYNTWVTTYGGEISWWNGEKEFSFTNTYTGIDDYYPIIIPTIINKDTGMLNKTDHFAYVIGYPDGTVHPNGQITRAEVATIFFRLLRDEVRDGAFTTSNTYSDVAYGKWYNNPISTMSALGIITGYPDGTFKPNKPITRAEFAAIAARFDETQSGKSATFSDVIGHWAAKEIGIAYYNDWIKGYPDGTFKPDQNITRAEAMTLINRVLERKPESPADLLTNMNKWTDNMDTSKWYYLDVQEATNSHGYTRKTFNYELWRQMLNDPDWSRYER